MGKKSLMTLALVIYRPFVSDPRSCSSFSFKPELYSYSNRSSLVSILQKKISFVTDKRQGLPLETLSSQVLEFEGKARANPIGAPFRCFLLG
jgi:hypothetical protein